MRFSTFCLQTVALAALGNAASIPKRSPFITENIEEIDPEVLMLSELSGADSEIIAESAGEGPTHLTFSQEELLVKGGNVTEVSPGKPAVAVALGEPIVETFNLEPRVVHGQDTRYLQTSLDKPYTAGGRLLIRGKNSAAVCSASLVGKNIIATARHCIMEGASYTFAPAYLDGERRGSARVRVIINIPGESSGSCTWGHDWAVMVLDKDMGTANGYFGVRVMPQEWNKQARFSNYGFPGDRDGTNKPYMSDKITVEIEPGCESGGGALKHDGDTAGGQSGSPIYETTTSAGSEGERWQIGVHSGSTADYGIAAFGQVLVNAVAAARKDFPA